MYPRVYFVLPSCAERFELPVPCFCKVLMGVSAYIKVDEQTEIAARPN